MKSLMLIKRIGIIVEFRGIVIGEEPLDVGMFLLKEFVVSSFIKMIGANVESVCWILETVQIKVEVMMFGRIFRVFALLHEIDF